MGITLKTLLRIRNRQDENRFHRNYVPSTKAVRQEAPGISWATKIYVPKLGRHVHCLSHAELHAAVLALHHPGLVDLHEQRMLHTDPAPHPLYGYPGYSDPGLKPLPGTLSVSRRLNCENLHPTLTVTDPDDGVRAPVAFPYQGDLLLFLHEGKHIRLVNWTVKKNENDFRVPSRGSDARTQSLRQKYLRRLNIERQYYLDIDVPTVEVSEDRLDMTLINNLRSAYSYTTRKTPLSPQRRAAVIGSFQSAASSQERATDVIAALAQDNICDPEVARDVFYQSVWDRSLRLDLYSNIVLNAPLRPEKEDVFKKEHWLFPRQTTPCDHAQKGAC